VLKPLFLGLERQAPSWNSINASKKVEFVLSFKELFRERKWESTWKQAAALGFMSFAYFFLFFTVVMATMSS
jgi:hypothetical protein